MPIKREFLQSKIESNIKNTVWYHESNKKDADAAIDVCVNKSLAELIPILESMERSIKSYEESFDKTRNAMSILFDLIKE